MDPITDRVSGTVTIREALEARWVEAWVSYSERTADFTHDFVMLRSGPLAQGRLEAGTTLPFSIQLPEQPYAAVITPWGSLSWQLLVKVDVPRARDVQDVRVLDVGLSR